MALALEVVLWWLIIESGLVLCLVDTGICEAIELRDLNDLQLVVLLRYTSLNARDCA